MDKIMDNFSINLEFDAGSVIQATGMVEIEDCLRTRVPPGGCLVSLWTPLGVQVGPGLDVVVIKDPILDQIPILLTSAHGWY